ncbi:MAG TPA: RHS repeat-associated core domain-containing protein, partial [Caproicibacter sp.]|nr:RHS repeat-associated core domain-containing protein [Caproicibacter sp.]
MPNSGSKTGNSILWFLYDSDGTRVGFTYNGTAYYYTTNAQGDVTGIVDKDCNTVVEYTYDSWGKLLSTTGSLADTIGKINPYLYRGYYYDSETGLYYLNSRYYDSNTGRFLNADGQVKSDFTGSNLFAYCGNNPISRIDPDGHSWWDVAIACLAVAVVCAAVAVAAPVVATVTGIAVISSFAYAAASVSLVYGCVGIAAAAIATTQSIAASIPHSSSQT